MKSYLPLLAAVAGAGAVLLVRPALPGSVGVDGPAPRVLAGGWSENTPPPRRDGARLPSPTEAVVYVAGAVVRPGVYRLPAAARVGDAVARSGGLRPNADPVAVNLAAHVRDGDEIIVAVRGAAPAARPARRRGSRRGGAGAAYDASDPNAPPRHLRRRGARYAGVPPAGLVDLNAADADTLASIPGIGPGLALRIVAFRAANGPFASADELLDVSGITDHRLDAILPYVVAR